MFTVEDDTNMIQSSNGRQHFFSADISPKLSIEKQGDNGINEAQIYSEEKSTGQKKEVEYWQITAKNDNK